MRTRITLWTCAAVAVTGVAVTGTPVFAHPDAGLNARLAPLMISAAEGGEGGEAGSQPSSYKLLLDPGVMPRYDASAVRENYVGLAGALYTEALNGAQKLSAAVDALLAKPSESTLAQARNAWLVARAQYLPTEAFRYYDGPIDGPATSTRRAGPESRINAWPLNEAVIDYVVGGPSSGLVGAIKTPITAENILKLDQVSDEADVTTGFHAIEFLLWGQDRSAKGAGDRKFTDFVLPAGKNGVTQRRRDYLKALTGMLEADLGFVLSQWDPVRSSAYAREFMALDSYEAVGRMVRGMAMLAVEEMSSERLSVALDSGTQEDEASCFSDNTHREFSANLRGIQSVWFAQHNKISAPSLRSLVQKLDPKVAAQLDAALSQAQAQAQIVENDGAFDQMLIAPATDPRRQHAEALVSALQGLGTALRDAGRTLGVLVSIPGV
jgi:putative iron-regulated protein